MSKENVAGFWPTVFKIYQKEMGGAGSILTNFRLKGPLTVDILQRALALRMIRLPLLRASMREFNKRYDEFVIDDDFVNASSWQEQAAKIPLTVMKASSEDEWQKVSEDIFSKAIPLTDHFFWNITLLQHEDGQTHDLIHYTSHALTDAFSTCSLANDIAELAEALVDRPMSDAPVKQQFPDLTQEILPKLSPVEKLIKRTEASEEAVAKAKYDEDDCTPWKLDQNVPVTQRRTANEFRVIQADQLKAIKNASKAQETTIHAMLTAAHLRAASDVLGSKGKVICSTPVNLRRFCDPVVDDEQYGCYSSVEQTAVNLSDDQGFWDLAKHSKDVLEAKLEVCASQGFLPIKFNRTFMEQKIIEEIAEQNEALYCPGGVGVSNLGLLRFPDQHGRFSLEHLYFTNSQVNGFYAEFVSVLTFNGAMYCCFSCADPLVARSKLVEIADKTLAYLEQYS